ncbi:MAG TPA: hypothetical protein VFE98_03995 [Candidatus Bathyarchaeia archaeon]|nr:hypothetical protein [Candidatus Bathyarchaeia archaeon]
MLSLRDENFKILISEAEERGITIQELIRAVIIPDWVKDNTLVKTSDDQASSVRPMGTNGREALLQSIGRIRS